MKAEKITYLKDTEYIYEGGEVVAVRHVDTNALIIQEDSPYTEAEIEEWEGSCICDDPEPENPRHGHKNSAGGYCCPHYGNTCGYHPEYG